MAFRPIAIVGSACVLPGALRPEELWGAVLAGRDLLTSAPAGRWRTGDRPMPEQGQDSAADKAWSDRGGYVTGFDDVFDPNGFSIPPDEIRDLDPVFLWVLHCAREAMRDANALDTRDPVSRRVGAVFGNLCFPSESMSRFAESVWFDKSAEQDPRNRFSSGLPALILEKALDLEAGAFALDAACASSLYAFKVACDWLDEGRADLVLAGAVNAADDLFIHVGFSALSALSRTGRSRPFHRDADGLVPAEGAGFLALKRLEDAERDGDVIHGVIRGIGLSNDGRSKGFLVPSEEGQARAIRAAYECSGVHPDSISLMECHATGTSLGDATEIRSLHEVFGKRDRSLPLGSLKSNFGHAITAAGVGAAIKVLEAMKAGTRPPTLHADQALDQLEGSPFRLLREAEPWVVDEDAVTNPNRLRRAGISAFGFGGNNAHMILEEYGGPLPLENVGVAAEEPHDPIAIVGVGTVVGRCANRNEFTNLVFGVGDRARSDASAARMDELELEIAGLGIPPNDLHQTLAQQVAVLKAGLDATEGVSTFVRERAAAYVGMGVDAEVARYGARWRLHKLVREESDALRDAIIPVLRPAGVVGTMPNIVTNRLNRALDLGGPSCSVAAEECSGLEALDLAMTALRRGEIDAAVVAAVDMSCEPVHQAALASCSKVPTALPGDAAIAVVIKRYNDAVRNGDQVYATIEAGGVFEGHTGRCTRGDKTGAAQGRPSPDPDGLTLSAQDHTVLFSEGTEALSTRWGHAHAASGLMQVAVAALALHHKTLVGGTPWISNGRRHAQVSVKPMDGRIGATSRWRLLQAPETHAAKAIERPQPTVQHFHVFEGTDRQAVLEALVADQQSVPWELATNGAHAAGRARLVIVADDAKTLNRRRQRAHAFLERGAPPGQGVHFREAPVEGELAFVFASAGTAYAGMGRALLRALPGIGDTLAARFSGLRDALGWALDAQGREPSDSERLWGASAICQLHAELTRSLFGLRPAAAIGYSSGESNSLFALGAWRDIDAMQTEIAESQLYEQELGGEFKAVARAWGEHRPIDWEVWNVSASPNQVRAAISALERVHLAIIHTDRDCVVAGEAQGCRQVVNEIGASRCRRLEYNFAAHVPEVDEFREQWLDLHRREVTAPPGIRFYSGGDDNAYMPAREACAQNILGQCRDTLDFPRMIERAWNDGVRIFVEHGPGGACSSWIRDILGPRTAHAVVVPLDRNGRGLDQVFDAAASLIAAGVTLDPRPFVAALQRTETFDPAPNAEIASNTRVRIAAHPDPFPTIDLFKTHAAEPKETMSTSTEPSVQHQTLIREIMQPAPYLPPASSLAVQLSPVASVPNVARSPQAPSLGAQAIDFIDVHRQFLEQQAEVHQQFLGMRDRLQQMTLPGSFSEPVEAHGAALQRVISPLPASRPIPTPVPTPAIALTPALVSSPARVATPATAAIAPAAFGLRLNRAQIAIHGEGKISQIYGALFERQDDFARQVRMPCGPLLLADRITGIDATPGEHSTGTLWSETDIQHESWYLNDGRMPAGILIESGQADLMLISYMGADFLNQGERVYRLLGCRLTFEADLPRPGDTLCYDIHVDGHAEQNDIRLFFFHYDCVVDGKPQIRVRDGQAGFFSDEELAASTGILWSPHDTAPCAEPQLDEPALVCERGSFSKEQVQAFAEGRPWECLGPAYDLCRTHTRTPKIQSGRMLFLDEIPVFDTRGGPWGRGYLRGESNVRPDDWFFEGHFLHDPCMPGTLMFEGCLQALSFYIAGLGFTAERDGWRFQPVKGEEIDLRCRGQVTPNSKRITYEVFVEEVIDGPIPTVYADLLCTVDGLKAFHARRVGLQLVPDWPLESTFGQLDNYVEPKPVAKVPTQNGGVFEFGYPSLLACAWGRPSAAFGPLYARFDGPGRVPRLPGPPYLFISRVVDVQGPIGGMEVGSRVEVEYDIPPDAWYFDENGARTMPFAVLLEAALQPCGWLASYIGSALTSDDELAFRNLDGAGKLTAELFENAGTLRTQVQLTGLSRSAGMIIVNFTVECFLGDSRVYELKTVFGFFPPAALVAQIGLATPDAERAMLSKPSGFFVDLRDMPDRYFSHSARLGSAKLCMLHRINGFWPTGGTQGLGKMRAERDIDVGDWYFKAHFFQDPVQPGSLGIEAMVQLLQFYMLETGMDEGIEDARFESLALERELTWKYRGQVIPTNNLVQVTVDITERGRDERGPYASANASLWCDGIRIYSAENLGMRIVSGPPPSGSKGEASPQALAEGFSTSGAEPITLDPAVDRWLLDHRPTWQRPSLPMMSIVDLLASALPGRTVIEVRDVQLREWVDFEGPRHFDRRVEERAADLFEVSLWTDQDVEVARGLVRTGAYATSPAPMGVCAGSVMENPYKTGRLFHGPAFQLWKSGIIGADGASAQLDATVGSVPKSLLHPALLDATLHAIPHDHLDLWSDEIGDDRVAYPARVCDLVLYGPMPTAGNARAEVRFDGFVAKPDLPRFRIQLIAEDTVVAEMTLVEACFAKGPLGKAEPKQRRAFLRDRVYTEGVSLSRRGGGATRLSQTEIEASDWMPGTIDAVYGASDVETVATKEHLAARERLHPSFIPDALPLSTQRLQISRDGDDVVVRDVVSEGTGQEHLDLARLRDFWDPLVGVSESWPGRDLMEGLIQRYVGRVVLADPAEFDALRGRGAIFVGNHQVQIESILVTHILGGLTETPIVTMANAKHESEWIGWLLRLLFSYPGCRDPESIVYFDPKAPEDMFHIVERLRERLEPGGRSFFVHCQGTRAQSCREKTDTLGSLFLDLAIQLDLPIVPVRFIGGLPVEPIQGKLEFPVGHARQDYWIGSPIAASELSDLAYGERRSRVLNALNTLGGPAETEQPGTYDPAFREAIASWSKQTGISEVEATLYRVLENLPDPSSLTRLLFDAAKRGRLLSPDSPKEKWLARLATPLLGSALS